MITLRNGNYHNVKYEKTYAEKLLISDDNQITPYHFHWKKMEDIINRGGGVLVIECYNSANRSIPQFLDRRRKMFDWRGFPHER